MHKLKLSHYINKAILKEKALNTLTFIASRRAIFRELGSTRLTRRLRIRDNLLESAEKNYQRGDNTRINALKNMYLGDSPYDGPTAKRLQRLPEFSEGDSLSFKKGSGDSIHVDFTTKVSRFNTFNAESGLQFVPLEDNANFTVVVQAGCETLWYGDIAITIVPGDIAIDHNIPALYSVFQNQIFIRADHVGHSFIFSHEFEHASHFTLWSMCKLPQSILPRDKTEYLAMLKELIHFRSTSILETYFEVSQLIENGRIPHLFASLDFVSELHKKQIISPKEFSLASDASKKYAETEHNLEAIKNHAGFEPLEKIMEFAETKYAQIYEKLFGVSLDDIKEIIDSLPMI